MRPWSLRAKLNFSARGPTDTTVFFNYNYIYVKNRWSSKDKKQIQTLQTFIVKLHNLLMAGLNLFEIVESLHLLNHKSKSGIFVFFGVPASSVANSWIAIAKKVIISKFPGKST